MNENLVEKTWHPTKNDTPKYVDTLIKVRFKAWWLGDCGHEWESVIYTRLKGHGCPYCSNKKVLTGFNDLATTNPELAAQWHPTLNTTNQLDTTIVNSKKKVWWKCNKGHDWEATVASRTSETKGCPYCILSGFNDLVTTNPKLAAQWHPTKNILGPTEITSNSGRKIWWVCDKGHEWKAPPYSRTIGRGCPICANRVLMSGFNDLATTNPELAAQWHPTKNILGPTETIAGSSKKAWWICEKNHEWEANIRNRKNGKGCPYCSFQISTPERNMKRMFENYNYHVISSSRKILEGKEIDLFLPDYNVGIEFNGLYWHSEKFRPTNYHYEKYLTALKANITLIQVWENDWEEDNNKIVNRIISLLHKNEPLVEKLPVVFMTKGNTITVYQGDSVVASALIINNNSIVDFVCTVKGQDRILQLLGDFLHTRNNLQDVFFLNNNSFPAVTSTNFSLFEKTQTVHPANLVIKNRKKVKNDRTGGLKVWDAGSILYKFKTY